MNLSIQTIDNKRLSSSDVQYVTFLDFFAEPVKVPAEKIHTVYLTNMKGDFSVFGKPNIKIRSTDIRSIEYDLN